MKKLLLFTSLFFTLNSYAQLTVTGTVSNVSCHGLANGAITLTITNGTEPYTFMWSDNSEGHDLQFVAGGIYSVTVNDLGGAVAYLTDTVLEPDTLLATATHVNATSATSNNGSITITGTGGISPYQYSLNGGSDLVNGATFSSLADSCYYPAIRDFNDCIASTDSVCITFANGVIDLKNNPISLYPVPANDLLHVQMSSVNTTLEICNTLGQIVFRKLSDSKNESINISMLPVGAYYLRITDGNKSYVKYFSVQR